MELEVKRPALPLWAPLASKSTGKGGSDDVGWMVDPDSQGETGLLLTTGVRRGCLEYKGFLRASPRL